MIDLKTLKEVKSQLETKLDAKGGMQSLQKEDLSIYDCSCSGSCDGSCDDSCKGYCSGCGKS